MPGPTYMQKYIEMKIKAWAASCNLIQTSRYTRKNMGTWKFVDENGMIMGKISFTFQTEQFILGHPATKGHKIFSYNTKNWLKDLYKQLNWILN